MNRYSVDYVKLTLGSVICSSNILLAKNKKEAEEYAELHKIRWGYDHTAVSSWNKSWPVKPDMPVVEVTQRAKMDLAGQIACLEHGLDPASYNSKRTDALGHYVECQVLDSKGEPVSYGAAVSLMDKHLCEKLHFLQDEDCTPQEFFFAYAKEHEKVFGEPFPPWVGGTGKSPDKLANPGHQKTHRPRWVFWCFGFCRSTKRERRRGALPSPNRRAPYDRKQGASVSEQTRP